MTAFEHLDLLRAHIERRVPELAVFLAPDAKLLAVHRRGRPSVHIRWSYEGQCYQWVDGPDAGARVGADAVRAAERIERTLLT
ncbi:hypothetical protein [Actinomadura geliboluensis]|uniref:hypothetical protein n=1 Tax=Actinomadura geliboluensis TaxID=882440 RepID=UPI003714714D